MAAKKKTTTPKKRRTPKRVEGTTREHRAVDGRELREEVKRRKETNGVSR
mgnify:CR=1 FL=1